MIVNRCLLALLVAHGLAGGIARAEEPITPLYRDASQPIEKRIDDLLGRMTLEETVRQGSWRVVEPGQFRVMVGSSSEDIRLTDQFEVK
jgi:hypothetical protein